MKCVVIGDIFITEKMMLDSIKIYSNKYNEVKSFYFGFDDRKKMRNIVKKIETEGATSVEIPDGVLDEIKDADMLMVHLCPVTREMMKVAKKLKVILCNRGGNENIDMASAKELNITVLMNPSHNANAVAEYTIGQIFSELRNISRSNISIKNGVWREIYPNSNNIKELKKMTVGIIGFGSVGKLVLEKLSGFKCRVLLYDPYIDNNSECSAEFVSLDYLLKESDIVTIHARTTEKKPIIGKDELNIMKPDSYLINNARSYLVDNDALYNALLNNKICGAAIDVYDIEPITKNNKFLNLDNVTLTNHRAGDTLNSYSESPLMMLKQAEKLNLLKD